MMSSSVRNMDEREAAALALDRIKSSRLDRRVALMEFCGGHTVAMFRSGIRSLLPANVRLLSGPGCPVCVTSDTDIDLGISLASLPGVMLATYGDMVRVPGSSISLSELRAQGGRVRVVYSALDALELARVNPDSEVVFLAAGFETSAPAAASVVKAADAEGVKNFSLCSVMKLTIPGATAVLDSGDVCVDGVIGPGHVSAVTGSHVWSFLPSRYGIPVAICGFESLDLLMGICALLEMIERGECRLVNTYTRAVKPGGNLLAQKTVKDVFSVVDAEWRGFGVLPASGLELRESYSRFDAVKRFGLERVQSKQHPMCRCGDVLRAVCEPHECPAFGLACTPEKPLGPCMVSAEGACAAYWTYGESISSI